MQKLFIFAIILLFSTFIFAQTTERKVVSTSGGTYYDNVNNFELDYTIGEPAIATISNASIDV